MSLQFGMRAPPFIPPPILAGLTVILSTSLAIPESIAQATSASVRGTVSAKDERRARVDGDVIVIDQSSGRRSTMAFRNGWFQANGLEPGIAYSVVVRSIGFEPAGVRNITLALGEERRISVEMRRSMRSLDTMWITSTTNTKALVAPGTVLSRDALASLPSLDRDFHDFVRLTPFASVRSTRSGMSIAGTSTRYNNFLIDGVSDRGLLGNFSAGVGQGAKPISLEAVKEYQLLVAPFDARYGDFAGGLLNAVTRSGGATIEGSLFGFSRSDDLARRNAFVERSPYRREQYGLAFGGPLIRRRLHFFVAAERQMLTNPAKGPFAGGPVDIPVRDSDISQFNSILSGYGLPTGSAGEVILANPVNNVFVRLDWSLERARSRAVLWHNFADAANASFTREVSSSFFTRTAATFPLSTMQMRSVATKRTTAAQLLTSLSPSWSNEATIAIKTQPNATIPGVRSPLVSVAVPQETGSGVTYLESGSAEPGHGVGTDQRSVEISDVLMFAHSRGSVTTGFRFEGFEIDGRGLPGSYGSWLFGSLDSLKRGLAVQYRLVQRLNNAPPTRGSQLAVFGSTRTFLSKFSTLTVGVRGEMLKISGAPPYSGVVDSIFNRNTRAGLGTSIDLSPRIGLEMQRGANSFAAGVGIFAARPPLGWLGQIQLNAGSGALAVVCTAQRANDPAGPVPFVADYRSPPTTCLGGRDTRTQSNGPLNFAEKGRALARVLRASASLHRELHSDLSIAAQGLFTRSLTDFAFENLNLADNAIPPGSEQVDGRGRVIFGSFDASLRGRPRLVSNRFSEVIEMRSHNRGYSAQVSASVSFNPRAETGASVSYSMSRVRDVQTPPSQFAFNENWQSGGVVAGRHDAITLATSGLEVPHRIIVAGRHRIRSKAGITHLSMYYIGESGLPYTYTAFGAQGRGDLNADGSNLNDPIYVPRTASDTAEILFAGDAAEIASQQREFQTLLESQGCLKRQVGSIMRRNSCRAPWINVTAASVRHALPLADRSLSFQIDAFNLLNVLNADWGKVRTVATGQVFPLLEHVGQTGASPGSSRSVFRFNRGNANLSADNSESAFQLQLGIRYDF